MGKMFKVEDKTVFEIACACLRVNPEDRKGALAKVMELTRGYT